ncbi:hypothetical protein [Flavobacterium sp. AG291]|uniref:hypothetical protein n=1 Tax=Flavobacterium sp. AG291 TaxID=2184000 RepID=UPI000E2B1C7F|nr:hypothetical protein [Flavobacterium sp. AG291]RDI15714.1 hypothetical protein DEU42_1011 [Flavobacterium sp. AG291]
MKRISGKFGPVYRKLYTAFCVAIVFVMIYLSFTKNFPPFIFIIPLIFACIAYFTKREVVYIDKNDLVVKGKKILITDVISIEKEFILHIYKVRYYDGDKIKSFKFEIDRFLPIKPDFIKKLQVLVVKNNHNTSLL